MLCCGLFAVLGILVYLSIPKFIIGSSSESVLEYSALDSDDFYIDGKSFFYSIRLNSNQYEIKLPKTADAETIKVSVNVKSVFGWDKFIYKITGLGKVSKSIKTVPVSELCATCMGNFLSGEIVDTSTVLLSAKYIDGNSLPLKVSDVKFDDSIKKPLKDGLNSFNVSFHNVSTQLRVNAIDNTNTNIAVYSDKFSREMDEARYKYYGKNICVAISEKSSGLYGSYLLTHVIVDNPAKQLLGAFSSDTFGGDVELATSCAKRKKWKVGINGSPVLDSTGTPVGGAVFIRDGKIVSGDTTNGYEICMKKDGTLYSPKSGISASELISKCVIQSWGSSDPVLISGGKPKGINENDYDNSGAYTRTVIGMVKPGEYYIITCGVSGDCGLSLIECRNIMSGLGCSYARSMGSGEDSSLVFQNGLVNHPMGIKEKAVGDFLYFVGE